MVVYTYRYMWKCSNSASVNFKIVSDTDDGLKLFEEALLKLPDLESVAREYLHEYDVSKIGLIDKIFDKEEKS